jgi:hypothetical protein
MDQLHIFPVSDDAVPHVRLPETAKHEAIIAMARLLIDVALQQETNERETSGEQDQ